MLINGSVSKLLLLTSTMLLVGTPIAMANGDVTMMQVMAGSAEMRGTTSFYYSNEWLTDFVQFFISFMCIAALLMFYAGWLCSVVVLSNKEMFYLIDTIKKEASDSGDDKGFSAISVVMTSFKKGSKDGINGGLDNVIVFLLSMMINFKGYSYYKDVEAGSSGDDSTGGSKFNYNDTVLSFILKTLLPAVSITFVTSTAISGILLKSWFTIGDVFIIRAERFSNTNLTALIDSWIGDDVGYNFTIGASGLHGPELAEEVSRKIYATVKGQFPNATTTQLNSIGMEIEDTVKAKMLGSNVLDYYKTLEKNAKISFSDVGKTGIVITNESQAKLLSASVIPNVSAKAPGAITIPMSSILEGAEVTADATNQRYRNDLNFHIIFSWDSAKAGNMTDVNGAKVNNGTTQPPITGGTIINQ